jgi:hypothetical protein
MTGGSNLRLLRPPCGLAAMNIHPAAPPGIVSPSQRQSPNAELCRYQGLREPLQQIVTPPSKERTL